MENLEEWSSVMEEKIERFSDFVNRLRSAISNAKKKKETKAKHGENVIQGWNVQKKDARRVEDPGDEVTDEV